MSGSLTLDRLDTVIQKAMGWHNAHLHEFIVGEKRYGVPIPDEPEYEVLPEWSVTLREIAPIAGRRFRYIYDLGDGWMHDILVETIQAPKTPLKYPVCLAGERACPPEDCGGPPGYASLLETLDDPTHPQHEDLVEWVGGSFDPEAFDLAKVNRKLRLLK